MSSSLQAWAFLSHLPVVELRMSVKGWWEGYEEQTERVLPANVTNIRDESCWLPLHADQEYVLQVSLHRLNAGQQRVSPPMDGEILFLYCPALYSILIPFLSEEAGQQGTGPTFPQSQRRRLVSRSRGGGEERTAGYQTCGIYTQPQQRVRGLLHA